MAKDKVQAGAPVQSRADRIKAKREEMEAKGCPFGRYKSGAPRLKAEVPEEFRQQYSVYGVTRGDGSKVFVNSYRSLRRAKKSVEDNLRVLRMALSAVEIMRTRKVEFMELP